MRRCRSGAGAYRAGRTPGSPGVRPRSFIVAFSGRHLARTCLVEAPLPRPYQRPLEALAIPAVVQLVRRALPEVVPRLLPALVERRVSETAADSFQDSDGEGHRCGRHATPPRKHRAAVTERNSW